MIAGRRCLCCCCRRCRTTCPGFAPLALALPSAVLADAASAASPGNKPDQTRPQVAWSGLKLSFLPSFPCSPTCMPCVLTWLAVDNSRSGGVAGGPIAPCHTPPLLFIRYNTPNCDYVMGRRTDEASPMPPPPSPPRAAGKENNSPLRKKRFSAPPKKWAPPPTQIRVAPDGGGLPFEDNCLCASQHTPHSLGAAVHTGLLHRLLVVWQVIEPLLRNSQRRKP